MKSDNELIAEFMGAHVVASFTTPAGERTSCTLEYFFNKKIYLCRIVNGNEFQDIFQFKTSWDWLMPVVEKISKIHDSKFVYDVDKIRNGDWPKDDEYMEVIARPIATPISEVHKAVVEFIKWHNEQK